MAPGPAFGQADLTNCEREQIHLAGSIQPCGALLVLREADLAVVQATANTALMLGHDTAVLLGQPLGVLGGDVLERVQGLQGEALTDPVPLRCRVAGGGAEREFEGTVHRVDGAGLVLELEPTDAAATGIETVALDHAVLIDRVSEAVNRFGRAFNIGTLSDAAVQCFRDITGYDRVMVYKFDPDGHGKIIAEARDPRLDSLLGHHYPATDIPQRARDLYVRNRVRVLADVHYVPVPLVPRLVPATGAELDMSRCHLRSMSPLHTQYLKNMGVTATLVVSLVREGRLWGLVACHHYSPRNLRFAVRAAADLLAEVISTRLAAIENYAYAQVAILVRRLEQRLVEATSTEGDWRLALFRNPRTLLQPLDATGAALFHDDEILTAGEVPSTPELRALLRWVGTRHRDEAPFACASVARIEPALDSVTPTASGVLAVKLSASRPDYLMWFRKEQLLTVTWAGDPSKPVVNDDPLELSPRRSFAAWSEIVRGTALPWSNAEIALARAIGHSLVDIILQVHAVRLLIAQNQLAQMRTRVQDSREAVVLGDAGGRILFTNDAFLRLIGRPRLDCDELDELAPLFTQPATALRVLGELRTRHQTWRGELALMAAPGSALPVSVRAEVVPGRDGTVLGFMLIFLDLTESKLAAAARRQLERSLTLAGQDSPLLDPETLGPHQPDEVIGAILANASLAAMDIADAEGGGPPIAPLLEELDVSTRRAAALYGRIREFSGDAADAGEAA